MTSVTVPIGTSTSRLDYAGIGWAGAAYGWWAFMPIYFKFIGHVPAQEILAHRVVWSFPVLMGLLTFYGRWAVLREVMRHRPTILALVGTASLLAINWFTFIWAVNHGQTLQASLGYFMTPLLSVLMGFVFLKERLTRIEIAAVVLAAAGVMYLTWIGGVFPWIAIILACSFGSFGLIRKVIRVESLEGLTVEIAFLLPLAFGYLVASQSGGSMVFGHLSWKTDLLLSVAGLVTVAPLIWFAIAIRRLRLATIGLMQYIAPTGQFLLAVFAFGEAFDRSRLVAFTLIWTAIGIYSIDNYRRAARAARDRGDLMGDPAPVAPDASSV